jgi:hypothetical protein
MAALLAYFYSPLSTSDEEEQVQRYPKSSTFGGLLYPGDRRAAKIGSPPSGSILVKTAGNALQAVDRQAVSPQQQEHPIVAMGIPVANPTNATPESATAENTVDSDLLLQQESSSEKDEDFEMVPRMKNMV